MTRRIHLATLISDVGVSALRFRQPRPINLRVSTWTNRREAVTCRKCLERMRVET